MSVIHAIGRRKESIARVYLSKGKGSILINGRELQSYFSTPILQYVVNQPFQLTELQGKLDANINVSGGGITGQAEASRLAISRALNEYDSSTRSVLKKEGILTRDARVVERKKYGRKKARKRFQFSKR